MKLALAFLAVLAMASPLSAYKLPTTGSGALAKELQDFINLTPIGEIVDILKSYWVEDEEFQTAIKVLGSPELKLYIRDVESSLVVRRLVKYCQKSGLNAIQLIKGFNHALGLAPIGTLDVAERNITGGIHGMLSDIGSVLPLDELKDLFKTKLENSKVFANFLRVCSAPENLEYWVNIHKNKHFINLVLEAVSAGLSSEKFENTSHVLIMSKAILARVSA